MIIVVKGRSIRRIAIKSASYAALLVMFYLYYNHMATKFQTQESQLVSKMEQTKQQTATKYKKEYEDTIYKEAQIIADLLGKQNVYSAKIKEDRLVIIADVSTDIEPVLIRYGANVFYKKTQSDIKIAIDVAEILQGK